ncbi:hypothetical protein Tco_0316224 [Tanacetum coccineum]
MDKEIDLEKKIKELDNIVYKVGQSAQIVYILTKPQVFYDDTQKQALGYQNQFYLKKAQRIKPTLYDGSVISSQHINQLSEYFGKRFVPQQELSVEQAFWLQTSHPNTDQSATSPIKIKAPRELPKVSMVNTSLKKLKYHLGKYETMVKKRITHDAITEGGWGFEHTKKCSVDKKLFEIEKKELKLENERLLEHIICQYVVNIVMHANDKSLLISQDLVHTTVNSLAAINDYKSMEKSYVEAYNQCLELETELSKRNNMIEQDVFIELSKRYSQLEQHCIFLEIVVQQRKESFQNDKPCENQDASEFHEFFIIYELEANCRESVNKPKVSTPAVLKIDLEPLSSKLKNNREAHVDYIRITKENADTLRDIVEQTITSNPLDNALAYACMYTKQIQELLVYVSDTCHSSPSRSKKLVAVTPMNKAKKVTFAKTSTTSENNTQKQVDPHKTQTTNKPLVLSTNVKSSTNASGSITRSTTKNTRILQTSNSNKKYQRVEAHIRNVKSSLDKGNSMSKSMCSTCKKCLFDANHDLCVVNYLSNVNAHARAKSVKSIKKKEWKTTGKMFKNVGYKWVPTRRTFTLAGNKFPLTRFTSTKIVPPRKPFKSTVMKNIKPSSASQWRPRETKHVCSSCEPRIVEARTTNHLEPNKNRGSNVSISPCSSCVQCRSYKSYLGCALLMDVIAAASDLGSFNDVGLVQLWGWTRTSSIDSWIHQFRARYFNPPLRVVSLDSVAVAAPRAVDPADSPSSTTID